MTNRNQLFEAIGGINDDIAAKAIKKAERSRRKRPLRITAVAAASLAAALALAVGIRNWGGIIGNFISSAGSLLKPNGASYEAPDFGESGSPSHKYMENTNEPQTFTKDFDGVILTVTTDKSTYDVGEPINVTATLENKSDKDINLLYGAATTDDSAELMPHFEHLIEYPIRGDVCRDCVMTIIPFRQGEKCVQNFTFQTYTDYLNGDITGPTVMPDYDKPSEPGVHSGKLRVQTCSDMEYPYGTITDYSLDFSVTLK